MRFMLSYDLRKPTRNYDALYDELDKFKAKRVLESQWVFKHENINPKNLRDHFASFIGDDDRILITTVEDWASTNAITKISNI